MAEPTDFLFDAEKMAELLNSSHFTKGFSDDLSGNSQALAEAQKKNMEALIQDNKAAAASYQNLFEKQIALFEKTMAETKTRMENSLNNEGADTAKTAFEQAFQQMGDMANTAQKTNAEAMEIIGKRAQDSITEMQDRANKTKNT